MTQTELICLIVAIPVCYLIGYVMDRLDGGNP